MSQFDLEHVRVRYARLVAGDFHEEDATKLFEYLRSKWDRRVSVKEVADSLAHQGKRVKGDLVVAAQKQADALAVSFWRHAKTNVPARMPDRYKEGIRHILASIRFQDTRQRFGFKTSKAADEFLEGALSKFEVLEGSLKLREKLTYRERGFLNALERSEGYKEVFTAKELIADLNYLIAKEQISDKGLEGDAATFVTLFALSRLHNTYLQLKGYPDGLLTLNQGWGKLYCVLKIQIPWWNEKTGHGPTYDGTEVVLSHMTTDLVAEKYCKDQYLDTPRPGGGGGGLPLEVTPQLTLEPIQLASGAR